MGGLVPPDEDCMMFPAPGRICSVKEPVITLVDASFKYEDMKSPVLDKIDVKLTMSSRIGIIGKNGSGKSTLLALLARRLKLTGLDAAPSGELWWHKGLRLAYVAQHSIVHVGEYLDMTPLEYVQLRFRQGFDNEMPSIELPTETKK